MSTSFGLWCADCREGFWTDMNYTQFLNDAVKHRAALLAILPALEAFNAIQFCSISLNLTTNEITDDELYNLLAFLQAHRDHAVSVQDEYKLLRLESEAR